MRAWPSLPIFSSQATIRASSYDYSSHSLLKVTGFLLPQIPWMKESHDLGRPFKVVITIFAFSTASSCSLIWETLVKYDCMVCAFYIFTFFNCFLKVTFWFMLFRTDSLVKESNISSGVFREDTFGIRWSLIEFAMILLALINFFLCKALPSSPSRTGTSPLM